MGRSGRVGILVFRYFVPTTLFAAGSLGLVYYTYCHNEVAISYYLYYLVYLVLT